MTNEFSRRRFLAVGATAAAAIGAIPLLGACSSDSNGGSTGSGTASGATSAGASTTASGGPKKGGTLRFATSGGTPKDTVDPATSK